MRRHPYVTQTRLEYLYILITKIGFLPYKSGNWPNMKEPAMKPARNRLPIKLITH